MKRKFTILITAALMLLTMMATTGTMWGQTRTTQTLSYGFETGDDASSWTIDKFTSVSSFGNVNPYHGSKFGNTNGNSVSYIRTKNKVDSPQSLTCYYTKLSTNTNSNSKFMVQVSSNGSTWTTVASGKTMNNVTLGTWEELTADLSGYSEVYVQVKYDGTSANRALDYIVLTYDDGQSPSTDPVISFNPVSVTLGDVLINNEASTTFAVSQSNLGEDITLDVNNGELSQYSIDKDANPTSITWTHTPTAAGLISATVTATSGETSQTLEISGTAIAPVEGYDIDFEYATSMYPNWSFDNMTTNQTGSITAHGGTYYGTTGGKTTASITTSDVVENPGTLTCYVSKQSGNTTSSTWYIQVSSDGSTWTEVETQSATSMSQGSWVEFSADLSSYSDVYVRVYYSGSTAIRNIDDLTLTTATPSNIFTITYDANTATSGTVPVDETQYDADNNTVTVLGNTGNLAKAGYNWSGWNTQADGEGTTYQADDTFEITESTTLYAKWNAKTITGLLCEGTPTATQYAGQAFNPEGLTVTATFNDDSQEDVTLQVVWTPNPLIIETTSVTGTYMEQIVVVEGITVTYAPGSQENPYTVAQARAAIDAGTGITGVYATGIVSQIVTAYGYNNYQNITFNMVDEVGDEVFLQAFRCVGTDAPNVLVGDNVVVTGNLTKYQSTYEFAQGCSVVSLEHPSTPYITADDVEITYNATAGSIAYTVENPVQEGQLTAATTSTWLTLSTEFASPIAFTCSANEAGERNATVTLTYTYGNEQTTTKEVTVTQAGNPDYVNNISDITEVGTSYKVRGTVVATNSRGFVMGDGTGYVYYYKNGTVSQSIGDMVTIEGTTGTYGQIIQFTNTATVGEATTSSYNNTPVAEVITAVPDYSTGYHLSTYLEFEGALTKENSNYFINVGGTDIQISYPTTDQGTALTALDGKTVHVKGYFSGINSSSKFTVMLESAEEVVVPTITLEQYTYNLNANGGDAELPVTYTNMPTDPQAVVIFYEANGETALTENPTWITALIDNSGNIAGHIDVNEGEARSAYFKVKGIDANDNEVYSNLVTINQEAAAAPSIVFETTSMNLIAGGESDRKMSFDYAGLGSTPAFSIRYYQQDGETPVTADTYSWLTATIENNKLNITAVANTGEARSAYLKVYGEKNENVHAESNLVTITQAEYVVDYATLPFSWAGNTSAPTGITNNGVGTYSSSPYLKFDGTGDNIILKINERPGTLTFDIKGNSFSGGTFKVQTSENGETYTDLKTYTTLGDTQNESFNNLGENVRYIKWIYTEKSSGNVGLGNIVLELYDNTPSITVTPTSIEAPAAGANGSLTLAAIAVNNIEIQWFDEDGDSAEYDPTSWLHLTLNSTNIDYVIDENTTALDRDAYFKVVGKDSEDNDILSELVSVTQGHITPPQPTVTVTPSAVNLGASATNGSLEVAITNFSVDDITQSSFIFYIYDGENYAEIEDPDPDPEWITLSIASPYNAINYEVLANDSVARTAYFKLVFSLSGETVYSDLVTVTQASATPVLCIVSFELDGGVFAPNAVFTDEIVEIEAGTYHLPSATKAGSDFAGWSDGTTTYEASAEYTVSADVEFTAQWTSTTATGTIVFGSASSSTPINSTSVTCNDDLDNEWTITTEFSGETSFTQNASYSQVGASSKPASSITFTMTLPQQKTISAFEAKFGGFSNTAGDIGLYVGEIMVGSGSLDATNDVIVEATNITEVGTELTVTVTNIARGVKCYYISYTLSDAPVVPVIDATSGSALAYIATEGSIIYEIANFEAGTMTAEETADWITNLVVVNPNDESGEVTFNVSENTSNESRSATVTLTFTYGDPAVTVTKDVTVTQNGTPSITVTPATANVAFAGGAPDFAVTYESLDIDNASDFDVEFYETSTSTTAGAQPTWITNVTITGNTTDGFTMTTTVAANEGAEREAYLKVYALDENTGPVYSELVTISQAAYTQLATYSLVTSVDDIVSGKHYIIASGAANGTAYAMGYQKDSNRNGVAVTVNNGQIAETAGVYEFVINTHLNNNDEVDYYTIYDAVTPGYLYASSNSANQLKTTTTLNDNGKWTIEISDNSATITAQGSNSRKLMRYNPNNNNPIFACYATYTTTGNAPCLYVKDNDNDLEYYGMEIVYEGTAIPDGETLTVGAGSVMTITSNSFTNNDPDNLIIEDGGQLIHDNAGVEATIKKNINGYSNSKDKDNKGYLFIASPVSTSLIVANETNLTSGGYYDLYIFDESKASKEWRNYEATPSDFTTIDNGKGYLYANKANVTIEFSGSIKPSVDTTINLAYNEGNRFAGWNLVGNPFACNAYVKGATGYIAAFYKMNVAGDGLTAVTGTIAVEPMEGIFVKATAPGQSFTFTRTAPTLDPGKGYLNLQVAKVVNNRDAQPASDNAIVRFDGGNDLEKFSFSEDNAKLFIPQNGKDYAVVSADTQGEMPVNFKAAENGIYTIDFSMDNVEFNYLHLIDNMTGNDVDLLQTPSYSFEATTGDQANRFRLVFNTTGVSENDNEGDNFGFVSNGNLMILGIDGQATVQVFDVTGRMLSSETFSGSYNKAVEAANGVYMIRLIQGENVRTQKIVIK